MGRAANRREYRQGREGASYRLLSEPILDPGSYGDDRLFVYLRLAGDRVEDTDASSRATVAGLRGSRWSAWIWRQPYDLGAEFYRWEFATAVAGSLVGIHPFDQPNVQGAKDMTDRVLAGYQASGKLSEDAGGTPVEELLSGVRPGGYLGNHAISPSDPGAGPVRWLTCGGRVMRKHRIVTTLGYGPRYLHSTGQLHKGGPNKGIFLQLTAGHSRGPAHPRRSLLLRGAGRCPGPGGSGGAPFLGAPGLPDAGWSRRTKRPLRALG